MTIRFVISILLMACMASKTFSFPPMSMGPTCGYESCNKEKPGMINVHLVPHSHDDVGWIITVDQYYYRQVQFILDGVVQELLKDPSKRFIYVEQAFFTRWYEEQDEATQNDVKMLVNQGRLEFILGGWSMNDEAATHYSAIIDNHKLGFEFLRQTFGECARPKIGWQIDPFGHSREQASLFAQFGFDGLFFGRLDYQDKEKREKTKTMEFVWEASPNNLGAKANLFTGVLPNGYNPPVGYCFDITCYTFNTMIKDNKKLHDFNVDALVNEFISDVYDQAKSYRTKHLIMTMGSDFNYVAAHMWYKELDKLIKYVNARQANGSKVNLLYSTPSCYLKQLNNDNLTWTTKQDDFFPYADRPHTMWSGYFTSRPALKYFSRWTNSFFQSVKQMAALAGVADIGDNQERIHHLASVVGVSEHHDAITGTSKQAVAYDYAQRLSEGIDSGKHVIQDSYNFLMRGDEKTPTQVLCAQTNVSICSLTQSNNRFQMTLYNPLAWPVDHLARVPVNGSKYTVYGPDGVTPIASDIFPVSGETKKLSSGAAQNMLVFNTKLPALGFVTYFVEKASDKANKVSKEAAHSKGETTIAGKYISITFNSKGHMTSMSNALTNAKIPLQQNFLYYPAHGGECVADDAKQPSGAYIFRPSGDAINIDLTVWEGIHKGSSVMEARQNFSGWASQVVRVYQDKAFAEVEWTVGPVPIHDKVGKEVVTRYSVPGWGNKGIFYTDSNGREILQRKLNYRPTWDLNQTEPIAGNYFPVNALISTKSGDGNMQFTVLTDRSHGGSSLNDGDVEIMLHRRLLYDDCKGVGEALNETGTDGQGLVVRGTHYLLLDKVDTAASKYRHLAKEVFNQPLVTFSASSLAPKEYVETFKTRWSFPLGEELPVNIHLLTLEKIPGDPPVPHKVAGSRSYLVRLEHFYENGEDENLSKPVELDIKALLPLGQVVGIYELALGGNVLASDVHKLYWRTEANKAEDANTLKFQPRLIQSTIVTLQPMEILTLQIDIKG